MQHLALKIYRVDTLPQNIGGHTHLCFTVCKDFPNNVYKLVLNTH